MRFLISFDTRKIPRRAIVHSAKLYLYLEGFRGINDPKEPTVVSLNSLEAYQIISTDWEPTNTTSVIPWHQDFLGIGKDVTKNRYVSCACVYSLNLNDNCTFSSPMYLRTMSLESITAPMRLKSDSVTTFLSMDNWVIWILKYSKIEPLFSLFFCLVLRRTDLETWNHSILNLNSILYRLAESDSLQPGEQHRWVYLDIQHAVRNWQIRQQPNYGLMLKLKKETSANAVMRFASSNHPLKHLHPKLIVCLTVPPW